jgi:hypothetical protein
MERQTEITWKLRKTLVTWLIEVHAEYDLRPETLYLAINYLDRVSQRRNVSRQSYQLLGTTALWIAAKYEENHGKVPTLKNLMYICCNMHKEAEFVAMEQGILRDLDFVMGHPTAESYLKAECRFRSINSRVSTNSVDSLRHCFASRLLPSISNQLEASAQAAAGSPSVLLGLQKSSSALIRVVSRFAMELTLVHKRFLSYRPSLIARASLLIAEIIVGLIAPYHHQCQWSSRCTVNLFETQQDGFAGLSALAKFQQLVSYTPSGHLSVTTVDPVVAKILAHLDDCLLCLPKQILEKYKADKFMNIGLHITSWIENR